MVLFIFIFPRKGEKGHPWEGCGPAVENYREALSISSLGVYAWIGINFVLGRFDHEDGKSVLPCDILQGRQLLFKFSVVCTSWL